MARAADSGLTDGLTKKWAATDKPIAALIRDLKQRGLLEDTLVICGGEFGRTPFREGRTAASEILGRDHFPDCFTMWMAGGGVRAGFNYGQTDELGFKVVGEQSACPRSASHYYASAGLRSRTIDVSLSRPRLSAYGRSWERGAGPSRLRNRNYLMCDRKA